MPSYLSIDPSLRPVIAYRLEDGTVNFWTEERGATRLPSRLRALFPSSPPDRIFLEQPQYYFKGDAIQGALTFAESAGVIKGILVTLGWAARTIPVPPSLWMNSIDPGHEHPTGRAAYMARKKYFDLRATQLFPSLPRKLKISEGDALCLLHYGIKKYGKS